MARKAGKPSQKALGEAIREFRKESELTQAELAKKTGLHVTYVSGLENGARNPTFKVLGSISSALGLSLSELVKRAER